MKFNFGFKKFLSAIGLAKKPKSRVAGGHKYARLTNEISSEVKRRFIAGERAADIAASLNLSRTICYEACKGLGFEKKNALAKRLSEVSSEKQTLTGKHQVLASPISPVPPIEAVRPVSMTCRRYLSTRLPKERKFEPKILSRTCGEICNRRGVRREWHPYMAGSEFVYPIDILDEAYAELLVEALLKEGRSDEQIMAELTQANT